MSVFGGRKYLNVGEVHSLLSLFYVPNDVGRLWTQKQVHVWMQAAGHKRDGQLVVTKDTLLLYFPELLQKKAIDITPDSGQYLYAIEVVGVFVKYGYSRNPRLRLRQHQDAARCHDRATGRVWLSEQHSGALANERVMRSRYLSREYLRDVAFETVVDELKGLPGSGPGRLLLSQEEIDAVQSAEVDPCS